MPRPDYATRRRRTADRAAQELADPAPGRAGEAVTGEFGGSMRALPEVESVLADAASVVAVWPAGAVRVARGSHGMVVRVHGDGWSLVFRVGGRVLVVLDRMPTSVWRIDWDPDWRPEITDTVEAVLRELGRRLPWPGPATRPGINETGIRPSVRP